MTSDPHYGGLVFDAGVVTVALGAVMPFVFFDLPGLLAFVAQLTATVACSAFVLRLMDVV
jgi:uncharacterized membrane protein (DUF485 family)